MLEKLKHYFRRDLWDRSLKNDSGWHLVYLKCMRIAVLSIRGFARNQSTLRASALTYYTLMSIVPVLAVFFAIAGGFGYQDVAKELLLDRFVEHQVLLKEFFAFSERLLEQAQGGVLAVAGSLILFWSVVLLLANMEKALNRTWNIKTLRSWKRMTSDYLALILVGPLLFILTSSLSMFFHLFSGLLFCLLFGLVYYVLPNVNVRVSSALVGGCFAGICYLILQWGYFHFQLSLTKMSAIYGSFAALPLFLVWVRMNWFLLLLGSEVSFATQTHEQCEYESISEGMSYSFRQLLILWIAQIAIDHIAHGKAPISLDCLMEKYRIPYSIAKPLLRELVEAGILIELKEEHSYLPNRDLHELRISDVLDAIMQKGSSDWPLPESKALQELESALSQFRQEVERSPNNRHLKDL